MYRHTDNKAQDETWKKDADIHKQVVSASMRTHAALKTHMHICALTHALPSLNTKPQVFSWKNTLVLLKAIARIIFSLSECSLSVMNLYLTAAQLYDRDFSAGRTFLVLSVFAERALYLLC